MATLHPDIEAALRRRERPRVTVVRPGALGDTVLLLPTLELLRQAAPGVRITLVGSVWAARLRPLVPWEFDVVAFDSPALTPLFAPGAADSARLFADADLVIVYGRPGPDVLADNAERFCSGPVVRWPVDPAGDCHAAVHFARAPGDLGESELPLARLVVPDDAKARAREVLGAFADAGPLAVHPGSGGGRKCWPAANFAEVARHVGQPVVLIEGEPDAAPCERFRQALADAVPIIEAAGLDLPTLGGVLPQCRGLLGNDSGVSHLAGALGVPVVAVFGPTDPQIWSPLGPHAQSIGGGEWPKAPEVLRALDGVLGV